MHSLMMMTSIVSEKSLARDTHTQIETHRLTLHYTDFGLVYLKKKSKFENKANKLLKKR